MERNFYSIQDGPMSTYQEIVEREQQFLLGTYARYPLALQRGKGVYLFDFEGNKYLDMLSGLGVNALGHAHPRIVKVIRDQAAKVIHLSNLYYNEYQGLLAEKLCKLSGLQRAFFSNSGTEAIEGALKLVRAAGHDRGGEAKSKVVALDGSFHGRTLGALSLTGQPKYRKNFDPLPGAVQFIDRNDIEQLNAAVSDETCAIVIEPIQGEGGIRPASVEFLKAAREAATRHNAALIFDEIQCGMGRTGTMFAFQYFGVKPDVVCLAKPIAAGLPLGAFLVTEELGAAMSAGKHGTTFGGGPLASRVALEYFAILEEEHRLEQVQRVGAYFTAELQNLVDKFEIAVEQRGVGMIQALELSVPAKGFVEGAIAEGVLWNVTQENVIRFLPPFLTEEKHIDKGIKTLKKLLKATQKEAKAAKKAESAVAAQ
ncbi:acetylornithine aminotransferase apoenzyme [Candidatus Koribacter versatilis Ellin345]|uniref:Acetylornithine aminotransferase n=2 Tax=Candidatus Korobacter versatilis TaxID=658062 RepID=Q1IU19_KORVE|nr:acetylornithine aminotransferase apoenzyme [Candidatus Koribacter versatilis Ellin345]